MYKLIDLSVTEKQLAPDKTKKETQEYYNYKIKEYLVRDYQKPKTGTESH